MTTDRLAALLHADPDVCGNPSGIMVHSGEGYCDRIAARLRAAGVTVAAQPAAYEVIDKGGSNFEVRFAQPAPDATFGDLTPEQERDLMDSIVGSVPVAQPAPDALRAAAQALVTATDALSEWDEHNGYVVNSHRDRLDHDVDAAWDALRAALGDEP